MTYHELCEAILTAQEEMLKCKIEANSVTLNGRRYGKLIEKCPPNMKPTIFGMTVKVDYSMPDNYDFLLQYEPPRYKPPQPQTNADRIRDMSAEELAAWLNRSHSHAYYAGAWRRSVGVPVDGYRIPENYAEWLEWLQQEAAEDES